MQVKSDIHVGKTIYYTNSQYIMNTCACVEFPLYLACFFIELFRVRPEHRFYSIFSHAT